MTAASGGRQRRLEAGNKRGRRLRLARLQHTYVGRAAAEMWHSTRFWLANHAPPRAKRSQCRAGAQEGVTRDDPVARSGWRHTRKRRRCRRDNSKKRAPSQLELMTLCEVCYLIYARRTHAQRCLGESAPF